MMNGAVPQALDSIQINPLAGHIGAEITGVDMAQPLAPDIAQAIKTALLTYRVIFFRDQHINHQQHIAFARHFGELTRADPHRDTANAQFPEILTIDPRPDEQRYGKDFEQRYRRRRLAHYSSWHIDNSMVANPPAGSILRAETVPAYGGDTQWTNLVAAYDGLSKPLRQLADHLRAEHRFLAGFQMLFHDAEVSEIVAMANTTPLIAVHPLVRVIPETGEKALFVSPSTICRLVGLSAVESRHLLDLFCEEIIRDEYRVRFRWAPGSVAFWDNRTTAHLAALDHDHLNSPRRLYRVTLVGGSPGGSRRRTIAGHRRRGTDRTVTDMTTPPDSRESRPRAACSPEAANQMIVYRVAVQVREARLDRARLLFGDLVRASRAVPGVISFDILQDPDNATRFVSIEVYENQAALDRQAVLPELDTVMAQLDDLLTDGPEGTRFQVFAAEPWPTA